MAGAIRIIICAIIYIIINTAITKSKKIEGKKTWNIIALAICAVFAAVTCLIPIENAFVTFSSPQKAYEYWNGSKNVILVMDGVDSSRVVEKKGGYTFGGAVLPKAEDGWKISAPLDKVKTDTRIYNDIIIRITHREGSEDYYLHLFESKDQRELQITDSLGCEIYDYKEYDSRLKNPTMHYYFIYVRNLDGDYELTIDGETFSLLEDTIIP